ncbi:MAG: DDE-type integrase/transposase/recombinase [Actinobacteria bacterium]|nr:DDE-type integrase/transposase/recombinase [Actinomycetota bacterium]
MSGAEEDRKRAARAEQVALFRYQLIREAADPSLSTRQRGRLVRELAARPHPGPFGDPVTVSRETIDRWIRAWRADGFAALAPPTRQVTPRTDAAVLELAAGLKREKPARTAAQVMRILRASCGWSPSVRTLQRHFERLELAARPDGRPPQAFGRFEASRPNELWPGDALHGPHIAGRKAYLFAFLDDHSRAVMAARWGYFEDSVRLAAALRPALAARGVPESIYVDNGSAFVDAALKRAAARLGIKITHSTPGRPEGRGKIERFFGIVRQEFLVEIGDGSAVADLAGLNKLFTAWYETVYHTRPHGETGQPPISRWLAGAPFPVPSPAQLREAFLWAEWRLVAKTATIKLFGGVYETDPALAGRKVECVFDPFDLSAVEVRWNGRPWGLARPQHIGRHSHPKAKPETPAGPPPPTGIDYLGIIAAEHDQAARRHRIRYDALAEGGPGPGPDSEQEDGQ